MQNKQFSLRVEDSRVLALSHPGDPCGMNWVEGATPWGTCVLPEGVTAEVERCFTPEGNLSEKYVFTNATDFDVFIPRGGLGIYTPFNDNYQDAATCMTRRCHAHLWCGGGTSYVCALRMNGEGPHLGLVLREGSLDAYSVERDDQPPHASNDRGDFILHPAAAHLLPGERLTVRWELFWHNGMDDFYETLAGLPSCHRIESDFYTYFSGEEITVTVDGKPETLPALPPGEHCVTRGDTWARLFVAEPLAALTRKRCRYIAERQQFSREGSRLDGAYLAYDAETGTPVYDHARDDINGGRERVAMGILVAKHLQDSDDAGLRASLRRYRDYILRELFNAETGEVCNDVGYDNGWRRIYNNPWFAVFFLELFKLDRNPDDLSHMAACLLDYYRHGGERFYAINIPVSESLALLRQAGRDDAADILLGHFRAQAEFFIQSGRDYPAHEVKYEQSIVAPACVFLCELCAVTGEARYRMEAKKQLDILSLFNGRQPDHRLYEAAIRHWDGYWFGKNRLFGDTFPHHWSTLTGNAYWRYAEIAGDAAYLKKAEHSFRNTLSLFKPDGGASCAGLYPFRVNDRRGEYYDPLANDQDWALYHILKYMDRMSGHRV